jgi:uncharacterized protein YjbJ (UPF0337 family)
MSEQSADSDSDTWSTDAIRDATDDLRRELEDEIEKASGKKDEALKKAKDLVDEAEKSLKKRT